MDFLIESKKSKGKIFFKKYQGLKGRSLLSIEKQANTLMAISTRIFTALLFFLLSVPLILIINNKSSISSFEILRNSNWMSWTFLLILGLGFYFTFSLKNSAFDAYDFILKEAAKNKRKRKI